MHKTGEPVEGKARRGRRMKNGKWEMGKKKVKEE